MESSQKKPGFPAAPRRRTNHGISGKKQKSDLDPEERIFIADYGRNASHNLEFPTGEVRFSNLDM
jgi:hypothetical protein